MCFNLQASHVPANGLKSLLAAFQIGRAVRHGQTPGAGSSDQGAWKFPLLASSVRRSM
jgi:hypothetical protein